MGKHYLNLTNINLKYNIEITFKKYLLKMFIPINMLSFNQMRPNFSPIRATCWMFVSKSGICGGTVNQFKCSSWSNRSFTIGVYTL